MPPFFLLLPYIPRRQSFEKPTSFSSAALSFHLDRKLSYAPCLLIGNEKDGTDDPPSLDDETCTVPYTFYSLKDKMVIRKKKFSTKDEEYMWPKEASLVGSSHGWLAYIDFSKISYDFPTLGPIYLTNPSLPFYYNQIFNPRCWGVNKIVLSSAPQIHLPTPKEIQNSYSIWSSLMTSGELMMFHLTLTLCILTNTKGFMGGTTVGA